MKDFPLLYPGGYSLPPGAYNHKLDSGNIYGVKFWSKGFTTGTNFDGGSLFHLSATLCGNSYVSICVTSSAVKRNQNIRNNFIILIININRESILPWGMTARI